MSDDIQILVGDCRERLRELPEKSVQTCVTSPPFFGLRDYGTGKWEGGDLWCDHLGAPHRTQAGFNERYFGREKTEGWNDKQGELREPFRDVCGKCGARRVDQQIGLEPTPACGRQGKFKIRADLTEDQRQYVARRLLDAGSLDA